LFCSQTQFMFFLGERDTTLTRTKQRTGKHIKITVKDEGGAFPQHDDTYPPECTASVTGYNK
jgi:hypothetical protein